MLSREQLQAYLEERDIRLAGPLARREPEASSFYAFVTVQRDSEGKQRPSNVRLRRIVEDLKAEGVSLEFVLQYSDQEDIEGGARATLLHSHGELVRNVFVTAVGKEANVWIVPKNQSVRDDKEEIKYKLQTYFSNAGLHLGELKLTTDENLPSKVAVLNAIRILAPITIEDLATALTNKRFSVPSHDWVSRMLDGLRKGGFVIRRRDGKYVLTFQSLKALGSAKSRRSPDVRRFLDLARRES